MIWQMLLSLVLVIAGTAGWIHMAGKHRFQDIPGSRSSHQQVTVRGGGAVFISAFVLFNLLPWWDSVLTGWQLSLIMLMMLVGLLDDYRPVSALVRLAVQLAVCAILLWPLLSGQAAIPLVWYLLLVVAAGWLINLYNFMDGIDGIAAVEAICVSAGMAVVFYYLDQQSYAMLCLLICSVVFGFLGWNFPRARIFMGDAGSGALGAIFVALALHASQISMQALGALLLLLSVFVIDATYTLLVRLVTGQKIWTAHNLHAYQKLSRRLQSHVKVTTGVFAYNTLWIMPLTFGFVAGYFTFTHAALLTFLPVVAACLYLQAGQLQRTSSAPS